MSLQYVFDRPVHQTEHFFGRQEFIKHVEQELLRGENYRALIIRGWRKSGKTSLLRRLQHQFAHQNAAVPVYFDLRGRTDHSLDDVMADLAEAIHRQLVGTIPERPPSQQAAYFRDTFLRRQIYERLMPGQKLLLLIDEFEAFALDSVEDLPTTAAYRAFFKHLNNLLGTEEPLRAIIAVGRHPADWQVDFTREHFRQAGDPDFSQQLTLGPLTQDAALALIRQGQEQEDNSYINEFEQSIVRLSGRWPYLLQLTSHVWETQRDYRSGPTHKEEQAVNEIFRLGQDNLQDMWSGLMLSERLFLAFLAANSRRDTAMPASQVEQWRQRYHKRLQGIVFDKAATWLVQRGILQKVGQDEYLFASELFRHYVQHEHTVRHALLEIDAETNKAAHATYLNSQEMERLRRIDEAITRLEEVLHENPNHLQARLLLGQILLRRQPQQAAKHLDKAHELFPEEAAEPLAWANLQLARLQEQKENLQEALSLATRAYELAPEGSPVAESSALLQQEYARQLGEQAWKHDQLEAAREYFATAQYDEGLAKVKHEQAIRDDEAHIQRLMNGGDWEKAVSELESLLQKNPDHPRLLQWREDQLTAEQALRFEQAQTHLQRREWEEAQLVLADVIKLDPSYQKDGRTAADLLKEAWLQAQAETFDKEKRWRAAALTYDFLTQLFPRHERVSDWRQDITRCNQRHDWAERFDRGVDYLLQQEWQKAITQLQGLPPNYEKDDISARVLQQMASREEDAARYWQQQAWEDARQAYRDLLSHYGNIRLKDGNIRSRWETHIKICQQEIELAQLLDAAEVHLAQQAWEKVREKLNTWQESRTHFERETRRRPGVVWEERVTRLWQQMELEELAQNRERNKQWEDAGRNYESLLHLFPNAPEDVRNRWEEGRNANRIQFNWQQWYRFAQESLENGDWSQAQKWLSRFTNGAYGVDGHPVTALRQRAQLEQEAEEATVREDWETARSAYGQLQDSFRQNPRRQYWDREYDRCARLASLTERFARGEKALEARNWPAAYDAFLSIVQDEAGFARHGLLASSYLEQVELELQIQDYLDRRDYLGAVAVYDKMLSVVQHARREDYLPGWQTARDQAIENHLRQQDVLARQAVKVEDWRTAIAALRSFTEASETFHQHLDTPQHLWLEQVQIEQEAERFAADNNWLLARKKYDDLLSAYPDEEEEYLARWQAKRDAFEKQHQQQTNFQDGLRQIDRALRNKPVDKVMLREAVKPLENIPEPESYSNLIKADLLTRLTTDRAHWNLAWPALFLAVILAIAGATFLIGRGVGSTQGRAIAATATSQFQRQATIDSAALGAAAAEVERANATVTTLEADLAQATNVINATGTAVNQQQAAVSTLEAEKASQDAISTQQAQDLLVATRDIEDLQTVITAQAMNVNNLEIQLSQGISGTVRTAAAVRSSASVDSQSTGTLGPGSAIIVTSSEGEFYYFEAVDRSQEPSDGYVHFSNVLLLIGSQGN